MEILYRFSQKPLDRCKITQPFGVDWVDGHTYSAWGLKGHNGLDFSAKIGTPIYAVADGFVEARGSAQDTGYGISAWLYVYIEDDQRLEIVHGHCSQVVKTGDVKKGDIIALSGNTGFSTGPHLHFGVRPQVLHNGSWTYDSANGYAGCINPQSMFDADTFKTPVSLRYGQQRDNSREFKFLPSYAWFFKTWKRLLSVEEYNALVYGYWDIRSVLDPAMYWIWSEKTKSQALKEKLTI